MDVCSILEMKKCAQEKKVICPKYQLGFNPVNMCRFILAAVTKLQFNGRLGKVNISFAEQKQCRVLQ